MEKRIKLLYAEDEKSIRENYVEILSARGYDVHAVTNGMEAWEYFQREAWDIVLLDMEMPIMSGAKVIKMIRKSGVYVPIVVLSGFGLDKLSVLDEEDGADDYVSKSDSIVTLETRLNKRLRDALKRKEKGEQRVFHLSAKTTYDRIERVLIVDGKKHTLKPMLAKVMWMLCMRKNEDVSSKELCERLWGMDCPIKRDEIASYVSKIRKHLKLDESIVLPNGYGGSYRLITPEL